MSPQAQRPARLDIGVVSAGRVGAVLGAALQRAGHRVVAACGLSDASMLRVHDLLPGVSVHPAEETAIRADVVLLCVPDPALPGLIADLSDRGVWGPGQIVVHTSARYGIEILEPVAAAHALPVALHPAMCFTGTRADISRLSDTYVAVTTTSALRPVGEALVVEMGAEPVWVEPAQRARYAAALAHAGRCVDVVVAQAGQLLREACAGREERLLVGYLMTAVEAAATRPGEPLGPAQGDADTLRADLDILYQSAPDSRAVHLAVARASLARATASGRLSQGDLDQLIDLLTSAPPAH